MELISESKAINQRTIMKSLWDDQEAAQFKGDLGLRVYTSRLLGRDPSLVLHGGGNTSVKITESDIFGEAQEILYVKGSGWDLVNIDTPGFAPVKTGTSAGARQTGQAVRPADGQRIKDSHH